MTEIDRVKATASVPGTTFKVEVEGQTLDEAQVLALKGIDQQIDYAIGGVSRGTYDYNKKMKDSVIVEPPIEVKK